MVCHTIFALLDQHSIVKDVTVGEYYESNRLAIDAYGDGAFAIEVTQIPVQVGDAYTSEGFSRYVDDKWVAVEPIPSDSEQIAELVVKNQVISTSLDNIELALVELYEGGI